MSMIRLTGVFLLPGLLLGCGDLDQIDIHPELRTTLIERPRLEIEQCLGKAAKVHQLHLVHSGILPDNTDKLLLQGIQQKNIAEVEISARGNDVTAVDFYYLPHSVNRFDDIEAILAACKR